MAFASVLSLKNTIELLLNSSHISLLPPSPEMIGVAYEKVKSLQANLQRLDRSSKNSGRKRVNAVDGQIREAVSNFEDVLESSVTNQIASQSEESIGDVTHPPLLFSIDLQGLEQEIYSFTELVEDLEADYLYELWNSFPEEEDEDLLSRNGGKKSKMVGLSDLLNEIRAELTDFLWWTSNVMSLVGMAGIGKTTIAREIFEDPLILSHYKHRAWVTVGRKYQLNKIARDILAQLDPEMDKMHMEGDDQKIAQCLSESLKDKTCLIVLDDLWDKEALDDLRSFFPKGSDERRRQILLTTRLQKVPPDLDFKLVRLLNREESWDLLRETVFAEELCPPQLKKAGMKIAENCEGLPLLILTIADFLSKAEKNPEHWNKVAEKQNSVFIDAYDQIAKVLYPSYEYLHQYLKPCFLYMGVFPQNYEIALSTLINMWIVEGFLEPNMRHTLEDFAMECLGELVRNSVVLVRQMSPYLSVELGNSIKTCRLHSSFWHLCNKEAGKNKFFHILQSHSNGSKEVMKSQRRLCIHKNILFGIKDMYNLIENNCESTVRSLLCTGPYHQYQVPICFNLRLLRVLDALTIHFYKFPMEVLKLVQLKYLALTCNGNLPASISKLWNLQFLIIHRHLDIKSCGAPLHMPIEIWDLQQLKHLQIMRSNLPHPNCGASLRNLLSLFWVDAHSCTKKVFKRIYNLKKLGIQIELVPGDYSNSFGWLNRISHLRRLESLKCVVMNPELRSEFVAPPVPRSMFPLTLRELHLSGLGYPWEYMDKIGSLPKLQMLKLQSYAFRGPNWEIKYEAFPWLFVLLIEDTDLVQWKVAPESCRRLRHLSIKHCYKLEELHWESDGFPSKTEVVDCNPVAVTCIDKLKLRKAYYEPDVHVHSSWDDRNLKS